MTPVAPAALTMNRSVATRPVIEAGSLAVGRGGRAVLEGVDLAVMAGERLGIVGRNGSGKTTLLRVLAGLDRPLAGEVRWGGGRLPRGPSRPSTLGVLFQGEVPSHFTVRELVTLGLGLDGPPTAADERLVDAAIARFGLAHLVGRACATLSGGEQQRAALARALVASPGALLLDEPTTHLDPVHRAALLGELDRLRGSVAVVLATHDLECAATCDRVALLGAGRIAALGPPTEALVPDVLAGALGVRVRRIHDPAGGPPLLRVLGLVGPPAGAEKVPVA
ncbi:MAG: ABC transporter ATP-binding protein [Planctomycetales bacterium]|nr:ABC transporter ATP-binding protein [Planctomycetales bacterium]